MQPSTSASLQGGTRLEAVQRLTWFIGIVLVWGGCILWKLVSLQVIHHDQYLKAERLQQEQKVEIPAARGTILDRNGQPLAISVETQSAVVTPVHLPDVSVAAQVLSDILSLDRKELQERLQKAVTAKRRFLLVKRRISQVELERLKSLHCNWIEFEPESRREYPSGEVAAHVLGAVYKREEGAGGVEKKLERELRGHPGIEHTVNDVKRNAFDSRIGTPAQAGSSISLTIDERIQFVAEREIAKAVKLHRATSGTVVVMNPYNGEILALANYPTFDPNVPPQPGDHPRARQDLGVSTPFEPGSIFKVITLSAALETTNLRPESTIDCKNGILRLPGRVIHEAHGGYGILTMAQVLEKSSNIGAIQIGARVGAKRMHEYMQRFGFGKPTGIALPAESGGKVRKLERWGTTSLASVSMGQEVSATSIQLARAASVIANGGLLVKPKLILKRGDTLEPTDPPQRVLRPETTITMRQLMEGVVLRGTAKHIRIPGYTLGGKTGTAQIFDVKTHHYTHLYNASFMGIAPLTNPKLVMVATLNGTTGNAGYGGAASGPVFQAVMGEALRILDVPKDLPETLPEEKVAKADDDNDLSIADLGSDQPNILEESDAEVAQVAQAVPPAQGPLIPNFRGKTVRQVIEEASELGMPVIVDGSGIARLQEPPPGTIFTGGERVRVQFAK